MTTATEEKPAPTHDLADRDARYRDLVPRARLDEIEAVVVGCGAAGRQLALILSSMGVRSLDLFDHDRVEAVNMGPQGFRPRELGMLKVDAVAADCRDQFPDISLNVYRRKFTRGDGKRWGKNTAVFSGVDVMDTRRAIWEAARERAGFFADGRMAGHYIRVFAASTPEHFEYYGTTLFDDGDGYEGRCTARTTLYSAFIDTGHMVANFAHWVGGRDFVRDQTFNLNTADYVVNDG